MNSHAYKQGKYAELMTEYAEHLYREAISKTERNYHFTSVEGTDREVDVCTRLTSGELIAFEVRDRNGAQSIDWVDQVIGKYAGSPFKQIWLCTFDGCTLSGPAIKKLEYHHINWRDFTLLKENALSETPVLIANAIVLDTKNATLTADGEFFQDLQLSYFKDKPLTSYIGMCADRSKPMISENFCQLATVNYLSLEEDIPIEGSNTNFDLSKKVVHTKLEIPLIHKVFVDYFDEAYMVKNNSDASVLVSTQEKSMFIVDDTLAIDFGFFYSLGDHIVFDHNFIIQLDAIPEKHKPIKRVRFMDVAGEGKVIPMKMFGVRKP